MAGVCPSTDHTLVLRLEERNLSTIFVLRWFRESPGSLYLYTLKHLAHNDLDVLIVDTHALEAIDLLDLVHQVLGKVLLAPG